MDYNHSFCMYSATYRGLTSVPWWPEDGTRYRDTRPRLVWVNDEMVDRIVGWLARCTAALQAEWAAQQALDAQAEQYIAPTLAAIQAAQERAVHEKFVLDFGTEAEDLWPAHLKSVMSKAGYPVHQHDIRRMVRHAIEQGSAVVGASLGELCDAYPTDHWQRRQITVPDDYRSIVVAELGVE